MIFNSGVDTRTLPPLNGMTQTLAMHIFKQADINRQGIIDKDSFVSWATKNQE